MKLYFDIAKLQKVADDFFLATGIGVYIGQRVCKSEKSRAVREPSP